MISGGSADPFSSPLAFDREGPVATLREGTYLSWLNFGLDEVEACRSTTVGEVDPAWCASHWLVAKLCLEDHPSLLSLGGLCRTCAS